MNALRLEYLEFQPSVDLQLLFNLCMNSEPSLSEVKLYSILTLCIRTDEESLQSNCNCQWQSLFDKIKLHTNSDNFIDTEVFFLLVLGNTTNRRILGSYFNQWFNNIRKFVFQRPNTGMFQPLVNVRWNYDNRVTSSESDSDEVDPDPHGVSSSSGVAPTPPAPLLYALQQTVDRIAARTVLPKTP